VPPCAGECRFVRGDSVGNYAADPDLWGFCGARTRSSTRLPGPRSTRATPTARRAGQDLIAVRASALPPVPAGAIMLSRTPGTCASCYRRHARHLTSDEQQPGHRTAAHAIQEKHSPPIPLTSASTRNTRSPADPASLQQRVITPRMLFTDSARITPIRRDPEAIRTMWWFETDQPILCG
jgi:hypothetical protein